VSSPISTTGPVRTDLRAVRHARGLTLERAAVLAGLDPSQLSRIERQVCAPAADTLYRIALAYGLDGLAREIEPFTRAGAR